MNHTKAEFTKAVKIVGQWPYYFTQVSLQLDINTFLPFPGKCLNRNLQQAGMQAEFRHHRITFFVLSIIGVIKVSVHTLSLKTLLYTTLC